MARSQHIWLAKQPTARLLLSRHAKSPQKNRCCDPPATRSLLAGNARLLQCSLRVMTLCANGRKKNLHLDWF